MIKSIKAPYVSQGCQQTVGFLAEPIAGHDIPSGLSARNRFEDRFQERCYTPITLSIIMSMNSRAKYASEYKYVNFAPSISGLRINR